MRLLSESPLRLVETVLSGGLRTETLLREVEAALAVQPLTHLAGPFPGGAPGRVSLACFVPASLFEDKPDVSNPEDHVDETENLEREERFRCRGLLTFLERHLVDICSVKCPCI